MTKVMQAEMLDIQITRRCGAAPIVTGQLSASGEYFAFVDSDRAVTIFQLDSLESHVVPIGGRASAIALCPFDLELAVAVDTGVIERFDLSLPRVKLGSMKLTSTARSLAYDEHGCLLAASQLNGAVSLFDLSRQPFPVKLIEHRVADRPLSAINLHANKLFGVTTKGRLCVVRQVDAFQPAIEWNGSADCDWDCYAIANHAFLPHIAVAGYGGYVRLYKGFSSRPIFIDTDFAYVHQLQFSSETGQLIIVGDSGIVVWDVQSMRQDLSWKAANGRVFCVKQTENTMLVVWGEVA